MSVAQELEPAKDIIFPPGDIESHEPPLESDLHLRQIILLLQCLELWWQNRNDFYAAGNLTIYYSQRQLKSEEFRGPDFFVVLGCDPKSRKSWVVWQEDGKYPNIIVELLSPSTKATDKGLKKQIYQDIFRTPEYFWFDPDNLEFVGFHLVDGNYQLIEANPQGWLWSQQLDLYLGVQDNQLRYFTAQGQLVQTPQELAEQEKQRAGEERQRAEHLGFSHHKDCVAYLLAVSCLGGANKSNLLNGIVILTSPILLPTAPRTRLIYGRKKHHC